MTTSVTLGHDMEVNAFMRVAPTMSLDRGLTFWGWMHLSAAAVTRGQLWMEAEQTAAGMTEGFCGTQGGKPCQHGMSQSKAKMNDYVVDDSTWIR